MLVPKFRMPVPPAPRRWLAAWVALLSCGGIPAAALAQLAPEQAAQLQDRLGELERQNSVLLARNQALQGQVNSDPWALIGAAALLLIFLLGTAYLLYSLAGRMITEAKAGDAAFAAMGGDGTGAGGAGKTAYARLTELPFAAPDGTMRAVLSFFIIVFGFVLLALQSRLGLSSGEALSGFIGAVISFYFAARTGEQAKQAADAAAEAARNASTAATDAVTTMQRVERGTSTPPEDAAAAAEAARAVAGSAAEGGSIVATARSALDTAGAAAEIAARLLPGSALAGRARDAIQAGRGAVDAAEAALRSGDPQAIARAAGAVNEVVRAAAGADNPATDVIADAIAGFRSAGAVTALLGLGGPAGLVAAIGVGAFQAISKGTEHFERWKARVLDRPYTTNLFPPGPVDGAVALSALELSPIFARAFLPPELPPNERFAEAARIAQAAKGDTDAARAALFEPARDRFASPDEFEAGLQEFRGRLLDGVLDSVDPEPIRLAGTGLEGTPEVDQRQLREALLALRRDPQVRDLDSVVLLLTGLAASPEVKRDGVLPLLRQQIEAAQAVAATAAPDPPPQPGGTPATEILGR